MGAQIILLRPLKICFDQRFGIIVISPITSHPLSNLLSPSLAHTQDLPFKQSKGLCPGLSLIARNSIDHAGLWSLTCSPLSDGLNVSRMKNPKQSKKEIKFKKNQALEVAVAILGPSKSDLSHHLGPTVSPPGTRSHVWKERITWATCTITDHIFKPSSASMVVRNHDLTLFESQMDRTCWITGRL